MFDDYSEFFVEEETEAGMGIRLRTEKTTDDLIETFRSYLAWEVVMAFMNEQSVEKLFVGASE